jgi:hypothetical protein
MMIEDRERLITALGGVAKIASMDHEARADALEDYRSAQLDAAVTARMAGAPTVAEIAAKTPTRAYRRGVGNLFLPGRGGSNLVGEPTEKTVRQLAKMPERPTLADFFKYRFAPGAHLLQSAKLAQRNNASEEVVLACLLHDIANFLLKCDHGYWGAQIIEPYVSEKVAFAVRYHQALRFFPDPANNYEYPETYFRIFGVDYVSPPHIQAAYDYARNHKWYMEARLVTLNDLYAFDENVTVSIDEFEDVIGRHFRQPKEGLGYDNSPTAHMWRALINPDAPL